MLVDMAYMPLCQLSHGELYVGAFHSGTKHKKTVLIFSINVTTIKPLCICLTTPSSNQSPVLHISQHGLFNLYSSVMAMVIAGVELMLDRLIASIS